MTAPEPSGASDGKVSDHLSPAMRSGRTRRARTRSSAIDATVSAMAAESYDDVSVAALAEASGLGQATLYGTFGHKSVLVASAFDEAVLADWEPLGTSEAPALARASQLVRSLFDLASSERGLTRAYRRANADRRRGRPHDERLDEVWSKMITPLHLYLSRATDTGDFAQVGHRRLSAEVIVDTVLRIVSDPPLDDQSDTLTDTLAWLGLE